MLIPNIKIGHLQNILPLHQLIQIQQTFLISMLGGQYATRYEQVELLGRNVQDQSEMHLVKDSITLQYKMAKKLSLYDSNSEDQNLILNEVTVLKELNHPHILHYYDIHLEGEVLISILQFCEEGDLSNYLQKKKSRKEWFSEKLILTWLMQLLMGLEYIHTKHIIHRLISAKNVYLNHQGDLKIGSFGSAKVLQSTLKKAVTIITAPCNMSPQMVRGQPYNSKVDIWALGCLIYQIAALKPLHQFANLPQLYDLIVQKPSPQLPPKYAKYLTPIYRKMMKKHPSQRPSATELLQQQIFVGLMKEYVKKKRIDSLDLKYIVPKRLAIHKTKEPAKKQKIKLPPISPNISNNKNIIPSKSKLTKTQMAQSGQIRTYSKQKKKEIIAQHRSCQSPKSQESQQIPQRITKINQKQGLNISHLYEARLVQIMNKYKPSLDQICEQTFQFQDLCQK